jgi:hypothetical protein
MRITSTGNVGINTATPNSKLDVNGTFTANSSQSSISLESDGDVRIGI